MDVHDSAVPGKVMVTVFWGVGGILLVDFTPPSSTINAAACQGTAKSLKEAIQKTRPGLLTAGILLHVNAQLYSAATAVNLFNCWDWEILPHPL
jgi:hypothetical protein